MKHTPPLSATELDRLLADEEPSDALLEALFDNLRPELRSAQRSAYTEDIDIDLTEEIITKSFSGSYWEVIDEYANDDYRADENDRLLKEFVSEQLEDHPWVVRSAELLDMDPSDVAENWHDPVVEFLRESGEDQFFDLAVKLKGSVDMMERIEFNLPLEYSGTLKLQIQDPEKPKEPVYEEDVLTPDLTAASSDWLAFMATVGVEKEELMNALWQKAKAALAKIQEMPLTPQNAHSLVVNYTDEYDNGVEVNLFEHAEDLWDHYPKEQAISLKVKGDYSLAFFSISDEEVDISNATSSVISEYKSLLSFHITMLHYQMAQALHLETAPFIADLNGFRQELGLPTVPVKTLTPNDGKTQPFRVDLPRISALPPELKYLSNPKFLLQGLDAKNLTERWESFVASYSEEDRIKAGWAMPGISRAGQGSSLEEYVFKMHMDSGSPLTCNAPPSAWLHTPSKNTGNFLDALYEEVKDTNGKQSFTIEASFTVNSEDVEVLSRFSEHSSSKLNLNGKGGFVKDAKDNVWVNISELFFYESGNSIKTPNGKVLTSKNEWRLSDYDSMGSVDTHKQEWMLSEQSLTYIPSYGYADADSMISAVFEDYKNFKEHFGATLSSHIRVDYEQFPDTALKSFMVLNQQVAKQSQSVQKQIDYIVFTQPNLSHVPALISEILNKYPFLSSDHLTEPGHYGAVKEHTVAARELCDSVLSGLDENADHDMRAKATSVLALTLRSSRLEHMRNALDPLIVLAQKFASIESADSSPEQKDSHTKMGVYWEPYQISQLIGNPLKVKTSIESITSTLNPDTLKSLANLSLEGRSRSASKLLAHPTKKLSSTDPYMSFTASVSESSLAPINADSLLLASCFSADTRQMILSVWEHGASIEALSHTGKSPYYLFLEDAAPATGYVSNKNKEELTSALHGYLHQCVKQTHEWLVQLAHATEDDLQKPTFPKLCVPQVPNGVKSMYEERTRELIIGSIALSGHTLISYKEVLDQFVGPKASSSLLKGWANQVLGTEGLNSLLSNAKIASQLGDFARAPGVPLDKAQSMMFALALHALCPPKPSATWAWNESYAYCAARTDPCETMISALLAKNHTDLALPKSNAVELSVVEQQRACAASLHIQWELLEQTLHAPHSVVSKASSAPNPMRM